MLFLAITAALATCPNVAIAQVDSLLGSAEQAYIDLDSEGFQHAAADAARDLPCLGEPISPSFAAHFDRVQALARFATGDRSAADASLRAVRVLEPDFRFADEVLPPDHELRRAHELADPNEGAVDRLRQASSGTLKFDGTKSYLRPMERATVFQRLDGTGKVVDTAWLLPDSPTPAYPQRPLPRGPVLGTAGVVGVAAGALYGLAWASRAAFERDAPGLDREGAVALQHRTNALAVTSTALGGLAIGVGVVGVVFGG